MVVRWVSTVIKRREVKKPGLRFFYGLFATSSRPVIPKYFKSIVNDASLIFHNLNQCNCDNSLFTISSNRFINVSFPNTHLISMLSRKRLNLTTVFHGWRSHWLWVKVKVCFQILFLKHHPPTWVGLWHFSE